MKYHRDKIRENYNTFVSEFASLLNDIRSAREVNREVTPEMLLKTFEVVLRGVKLLNQWNAQIIEQNAWKFANPVTEEQFLASGGKVSKSKEYEKALKFNYSPEEMYVLVDAIGMIKGYFLFSFLSYFLIKFLLNFKILNDKYINKTKKDWVD